VVAESLRVKLQSCLVESKGDAGEKTYSLKLRSAPEQELAASPNLPEEAVLTSGTFAGGDSNHVISKAYQVGGSTKAPVPLTTPEATYTDAARKAKINGVCNISLIVDRQGMPQNLRVVKSLDPGLDQNALVAVSNYRFKPATRGGEPVPVMVVVEVNFRLY
jgi:TonB family protein